LPALSNMSRAIDQIQRAFEIRVLDCGRGKDPSFPLKETKGTYRINGNWEFTQISS
jgi:hypothetical protein